MVEDNKHIKKIAVFRALQLGDMLNCIPALRALHKAIPKARITLIGLPWADSLLRRFPSYLHSFEKFPGYPGLPEQPFNPAAYRNFVARMKAEKFDLILQMQGNGTVVNDMLGELGPIHLGGFYPKGTENPDPTWFVEYPEGIHEIDRHLTLIKHLGFPSAGRDLEFPLSQQDLADFRELDLDIIPKQYICIHPGSRGNWRQWPPEGFAELANTCAEDGYKIVLTGTMSEMNIIDKMIPHLKTRPIIAAGRTSLGAMGVLINNARMLISNCTGVAHVAAALAVPSVVISMDGEPERWGPLNKKLHRTIDWTRNKDPHVVFHEAKSLLSVDQQRSHLRDHFSIGI